MDVKAQVTKWVEKKLGRIIDEDLKSKTAHECSVFNIHTYVDSLEEKYFTKTEIERLTLTLPSDFQAGVNNFDTYDSDEDENESKDSLEFDNHDFQTFTVDEIVKNLESDSKDMKIQALQNLEGCIEELINHSSWIVVQKNLLKILKQRSDTKMHNLVLKVFFKFLTCTSKPQIVCEGFTTVSKTLSLLLTLKDDNVSYEEIYDLKGDRWLSKEIVSKNEKGDKYEKSQKPVDVEVLIKLMWLLIHCQQQMPDKWIRFNEKRLREIIFSFVHLLHSTNSEENKKLSSLQLLSVLNPTASWCRSWCHTAVGRNLLCSALRKYKNFFIHMVEIIMNKIKTKKLNQSQSVRSNEVNIKNHSNKENELSSRSDMKTNNENLLKGRSKQSRSAPSDSAESDASFIFWRIKENEKWLTENIPKRVVIEAMFWHSVSVVVCLIQFRCGQALFPIQTTTRKRSLNVQDLSLSLVEYFESLDYNEFAGEGFGYNVAYQTEVLKIIELLKKVRNNILSSRMKMDGSPFRRDNFPSM